MRLLRKWRRPLMAFGLSLGLLLFARQVWIGFISVRQLGWGVFTKPGFLILTLACTLLLYLTQMVAWAFTLRCLGAGLGIKSIFEGFQISLLPRYIPGSVWGYLGRSQWLDQYHGIGYSTSLTASLIEVSIQALTAFAVGIFCYGLTFGTAHRFLYVIIAFVAILLAWLAVPRAVIFFLRRMGRAPTTFTLAPGAWLAVVLTHVMLWVAYGASLFWIIEALASRALVNWWQAMAASSLSWLVGFVIPIVPAGIGIREAMLTVLLTRQGMLSRPEANLTSVVLRFALITAELIWLGAGLAIFARRWHRNRVMAANLPPSNRG